MVSFAMLFSMSIGAFLTRFFLRKILTYYRNTCPRYNNSIIVYTIRRTITRDHGEFCIFKEYLQPKATAVSSYSIHSRNILHMCVADNPQRSKIRPSLRMTNTFCVFENSFEALLNPLPIAPCRKNTAQT